MCGFDNYYRFISYYYIIRQFYLWAFVFKYKGQNIYFYEYLSTINYQLICFKNLNKVQIIYLNNYNNKKLLEYNVVK